MTQGSKSLEKKAFQFLDCTSNGLPSANLERHNSLSPSHAQKPSSLSLPHPQEVFG